MNKKQYIYNFFKKHPNKVVQLKEIDSAVKKAVNLGNLSTLNCKEEVLLSEKLIEIHNIHYCTCCMCFAIF